MSPATGAATVPARLSNALAATMATLAEPGDHWTGHQRVAAATLARTAFAARHQAPWLRTDVAAAAEASPLGADEAEVVVTVAADARRIDRDWADGAVERVGAGPYVELVAIVATMAVVDAFAEAMAIEPTPLPDPIAGEPTGHGPGDAGYEVADIGAYVPMRSPWTDANVGRALTLGPSGNALYRALSMAFYHDGLFYDLGWDRPLTRPQTEVLATAVSAANECFY